MPELSWTGSVSVNSASTNPLPNSPGGSEIPWITISEISLQSGRSSQFGEGRSDTRDRQWLAFTRNVYPGLVAQRTILLK